MARAEEISLAAWRLLECRDGGRLDLRCDAGGEVGPGLKAGALAKGLVSKTIANRITAMAKSFIAGTDAASAVSRLKQLHVVFEDVRV